MVKKYNRIMYVMLFCMTICFILMIGASVELALERGFNSPVVNDWIPDLAVAAFAFLFAAAVSAIAAAVYEKGYNDGKKL